MWPKENFNQLAIRFLTFWKTNSIMWKYRQRAFIWMVTSQDFVCKVRVHLQNSIKHFGSEGVKQHFVFKRRKKKYHELLKIEKESRCLSILIFGAISNYFFVNYYLAFTASKQVGISQIYWGHWRLSYVAWDCFYFQKGSCKKSKPCLAKWIKWIDGTRDTYIYATYSLEWS